ncbi:MAG: S9 family peptidase [Bacteriovorax sp.]|jgi:oligopeptidase B
MNFKFLLSFLFLIVLNAYSSDLILNIEPKAEKIPKKLEIHGDVRIDNYFWLNDKKNEKVIDYLKAENAYTELGMRDTLNLQEKLYQEMRKRIKEEDQSVPYKKGNYFYYSRVQKGDEYPIYCRKKDLKAEEEILINVNELGAGKDFIRVTPPAIHPQEQLAAYGVDTKGDRIFTIYFKDLKTNQLLKQKIENVTSNLEWSQAGKILFYARQDPQTLRSDKIYRFDLDTGIHTLVFEEKDEKFEAYVYKTLSDKFMMIASASTLSSEVRFAPADKPLEPFKIFLKREPKHEYNLDDGGEKFIIRTNWNAKNFRIMEADYNAATKNKWKNLVSHNPKVFFEEVHPFKNHIVIGLREGGLIQMMVLKKGEKKGEYIKFPDPAYLVFLGSNEEFDTDFVRYAFESLNRPMSVFDYNIETGKSALQKEDLVAEYDAAEYISERQFATARDGTKVPVSLVYKKNFKKDGASPLLIYGYGSYGSSSDPYFNRNIVSLMDRGFVYAIAHVRGGSEMGRAWYENGKFFKKKNTFTDFIDVTEYLVKEKYAHPKKLYANGGSAGGLLMGAIVNMRPDLYNGVVAEVPFVDVVTTMLDSSLPLTTGEYEEWGNPNEKKFYKYMLSYSPYDNVKKVDYPNLLVTTGLNDSQVSYFEPTKWVAKMRELRTNKNKMLLLKIEMDVGHGGKSGRFEYLRNEALGYAFLLKLEGIKE